MTEEVALPTREERSGFNAVADFVRSVVDGASAGTPHQRIHAALDTFVDTYRTRDFAARAALFAESCTIEDPVSVVRARSRAEAEEFFAQTVGSGLSLHLVLEEKVVNNLQAITRSVLTLGAEGQGQTRIVIHTHFTFDAEGQIVRLVAFFDHNSITG